MAELKKHCIYWSREKSFGRGVCSIGKFDGHPYIGNCNSCRSRESSSYQPKHDIEQNFTGLNGEANLMVYSTTNIGDDIQCLAVKNMMEGSSEIKENISYIDREKLGNDQNYGRIVLAGWFKHPTDTWPPADNLEPLFIGFHADDEGVIRDNVEYLRSFQPIGCRDTYTLGLCDKYNLDAYWSGCVTMTLGAERIDCGEPLCVDFPIDGIKNLSASISSKATTESRIALAKERIDLLSKASCVITSRLHTALPCAALAVPVLLIHKEDRRFSGLSSFFHHIHAYDKDYVDNFLRERPENPNNVVLKRMAWDINYKIINFLKYKDNKNKKLRKISSTKTFRELTSEEWQLTRRGYGVDPISHTDFLGTRRSNLYAPYTISRIPDRGLVTIENALIENPYNNIIISDGRWLIDLSFYSSDRKSRCILPRFCARDGRKIKGHTLNLHSEWAEYNYGHWILDFGSKLSMIKDLSIYDNIMVPINKTHDAKKIFAKLNIDDRKIVSVERGESIIYELLTVPTHNGLPCFHHQEYFDFIRRVVIPDGFMPDGRRIYIRRGTKTNRVMANEGKMEKIAKEYGFIVVDPTDNGTLEDCMNASIIVGMHGAGLSNLTFAPHGSMCLEIAADGHQQLYYRNAAEGAGVRYYLMMAESAHPQKDKPFGLFCGSPVHVDLVDFEHAITQLVTR